MAETCQHPYSLSTSETIHGATATESLLLTPGDATSTDKKPREAVSSPLCVDGMELPTYSS